MWTIYKSKIDIIESQNKTQTQHKEKGGENMLTVLGAILATAGTIIITIVEGK